jgi:hypothetical protein
MSDEKAISEEIAQHSNEGITQVAIQADNLIEKLNSLLSTIEADQQIANSLKKVLTILLIATLSLLC